jgi:hypothetical protein
MLNKQTVLAIVVLQVMKKHAVLAIVALVLAIVVLAFAIVVLVLAQMLTKQQMEQ